MANIFSQTEAEHAYSKIGGLLREKRFFIDRESQKNNPDFSYNFDLRHFGDLVKLQKQWEELYENSRKTIEKQVQEQELSLGFTPPVFSDKQSIFSYNTYSGGFKIMSVFPLSYFLNPLELGQMRENLLQQEMGYRSLDDFSPNQIKSIKERVETRKDFITSQLNYLREQPDYNNLCVVLLKSEFSFDLHNAKKQKVLDYMEKYPELLGYLFYQKSKRFRLVPRDYVLFEAYKGTHVQMDHRSEKTPVIKYDENSGYSCYVHVALIM